MPRIAPERQKLRDAIAATTDPALIAQLTEQLNKLEARLDLRNERRRRKADRVTKDEERRRKREGAPPLSAEQLGAEYFDFTPPPPAPLTPVVSVMDADEEQRETVVTPFGEVLVEPREPQIIGARGNGDLIFEDAPQPDNGTSRVIAAMSDPRDLPWIIFGPPETVRSATFSGGEFDFIREHRERAESDEAFQHYADKLFGR